MRIEKGVPGIFMPGHKHVATTKARPCHGRLACAHPLNRKLKMLQEANAKYKLTNARPGMTAGRTGVPLNKIHANEELMMGVSRGLRFEVFKRDDFTCRYCGKKSPEAILEVDHVIPRSRKGTDDPENLGEIGSCPSFPRG